MGKIHQFYTALADFDTSTYNQFWSFFFLACYGLFLGGILTVWPSYTTSLYTERNTTLLSAPMTRTHVSLLGSLPAFGAMLGTYFMGKIIDVFGRQKGGIILMLPFLLSWTMVILTNSSIVIMIARFVGGFSSGAFLGYGPIFISEVAEKSIRGMLASGPIVMYCLGALTSYLFGWFLAYRYILWTNLALSIIGAIVLMVVTESPLWLVRQKRETDAHVAFAHYRGVSPQSKIVLEEILRLKAQVIPAIELTSITDGYDTTEEAEKQKLKGDEETVQKKNIVSNFKLIFISQSSRRAFTVTGLTLSMQVQSTAAIIFIEWLWLLSFFQLGTYPFIVKYFGLHGAFYYFSFFGIVDALVGIFLLPETKGFTNEQIQVAFLRKRKN